MRQPSNKSDKLAITKHSRHQALGAAVLQIMPNDFEKLKERIAISFPPDAVITGGQLIVQEAFEKGSIAIGDKETPDCYLASTALTATSVSPIKVVGKVMESLCDMMATSDSVFTSKKGKAVLIINYVGLNKSDWTMGSTNE